ncbi:DNRLRE domain-containing protein [Fluviicola sp.]|uniref:DNRLRE domain-containing protein n=1 Tax=Fluviicola sp. TaxID=1917219 RepID=UPI0031E0315B
MILSFLRFHALIIPALVFCFHARSQLTTSTLDATIDAQVYSGNPTTNFGTLATSNVSVVSGPRVYRFYVNFDINSLSIPANAVVTSAILRLTPTATGEGGAGSSDFVVNGVTSSWTETGITYASQPFQTVVNQGFTSALVSSKREFNDLKNMVQNHVNGTIPIVGFCVMRIQETTATTACQYNTREATTSTDRPKLEIKWYIPFAMTTATVTQASTATSADGAISPTITGGSGSNTYSWINSGGSSEGTTLNITGKAPGWYGLQVTGSLGDKFYMSFIIGAKCEVINVLFRQDPNFIDNATVILGSTLFNNSNFGTGINADAGGKALSDNYFFLRYRLWFDPNNYFYQVNQYLFGSAHSTQTNACILNRVTADWNELTITGANQPGVNISTPPGVSLPATATTTENKTLDITAYFRYWTLNPTANYGYRVSGTVSSPTIGYQSYNSDDATTASLRPYVSMVVEDNNCDRTSHVSFKAALDGQLYLAYKGNLKLQFTEEYQQEGGKKWPLKLYDYNRTLIAGINYNGSQIGSNPLLPAIDYVFGDNRTTLNFSSYGLLDGGYYILELTKSTGEKEYVEFIYKK